MSRTVDMRAIDTLAASASCACGTTALNAPLFPARKTTAAVESANATSRISQNLAWCVSTLAARTATAVAPTTSATIISVRRSKRSAAAPAGRLNRTSGANSTAPT